MDRPGHDPSASPRRSAIPLAARAIAHLVATLLARGGTEAGARPQEPAGEALRPVAIGLWSRWLRRRVMGSEGRSEARPGTRWTRASVCMASCVVGAVRPPCVRGRRGCSFWPLRRVWPAFEFESVRRQEGDSSVQERCSRCCRSRRWLRAAGLAGVLLCGCERRVARASDRRAPPAGLGPVLRAPSCLSSATGWPHRVARPKRSSGHLRQSSVTVRTAVQSRARRKDGRRRRSGKQGNAGGAPMQRPSATFLGAAGQAPRHSLDLFCVASARITSSTQRCTGLWPARPAARARASE